jgi:hypothetical protein
MNKSIAAALAASLFVTVGASAGFCKAKAPAPAAKVTMYKAAVCGMYFTAAQAKTYHYACPISHGKMSKVMVAPSVAKMQMAKTSKALKPTSMKHTM